MEQKTAVEPATYTLTDLSVLLQCSLRHVYKMDADARIPAPLRFGRRSRWVKREFHAWLEAGAPDRELWDATKKQLTEGGQP